MRESPAAARCWKAVRRIWRSSVWDYVDSLSADEKTDEATYTARLNICRNCDDLHSGTCALCGCYVEARAAKKRQGCPKVPEKWGAEEAE